jgi:hypothetical protein
MCDLIGDDSHHKHKHHHRNTAQNTDQPQQTLLARCQGNFNRRLIFHSGGISRCGSFRPQVFQPTKFSAHRRHHRQRKSARNHVHGKDEGQKFQLHRQCFRKVIVDPAFGNRATCCKGDKKRKTREHHKGQEAPRNRLCCSRHRKTLCHTWPWRQGNGLDRPRRQHASIPGQL